MNKALYSSVNVGDCIDTLANMSTEIKFDLTFLDPPFNQGKDYLVHNDKMDEYAYWEWMSWVMEAVRERTSEGGCVYFMQREKNTGMVMEVLETTGWTFQNLIIWQKTTSAVPQARRFGKAFQTIVFATNGEMPRVFNKLRINPPLPANYTEPRKNGMFVTDVWSDIRELTSGYLAGDEPLRNKDGSRFHKQQTSLALLVRMILASTLPGDRILDPFCGTGTTLVAAKGLGRIGVGVDIDENNAKATSRRLLDFREADNVSARFYNDYQCTENLERIWGERI